MTPDGEELADRRATALAWLERVAFAALLFLVAFPRTSSVMGPFDRSPSGERAAQHAIVAVNEVRTSGSVIELTRPASSWLSVAAARALGPRGWGDAQDSDRGPEGLETALRLPYFLLHLTAAAALAFALRRAHGPGLAMLALVGWAALPVGILRAGMPGPENLALGGALLALAGAASGRPWTALPGAVVAAMFDPRALAIALAGALAFARRRERRDPAPLVILLALGLGLVAAQPPSVPVAALRWADVGPWLAAVALAGVGLRAARILSAAVRTRLEPLEIGARQAMAELVVPLALGSLAAFALAREPLYLAPGIAAAFGAALSQVSEPLFRLRAGLSPLVALTTLFTVPTLALVEETRAAGGGPAARENGQRLAEELPPGATLPADRPELGWSDAYYAWRDLAR